MQSSLLSEPQDNSLMSGTSNVDRVSGISSNPTSAPAPGDWSRYDYEYYHHPFDFQSSLSSSSTSATVPPYSFLKAPALYSSQAGPSASSQGNQDLSSLNIGYTPHGQQGPNDVAAAVTQGHTGDVLSQNDEAIHKSSSPSGDELPRRYLTFSPNNSLTSSNRRSNAQPDLQQITHNYSVVGANNHSSFSSYCEGVGIRENRDRQTMTNYQGYGDSGYMNEPSKLLKYENMHHITDPTYFRNPRSYFNDLKQQNDASTWRNMETYRTLPSETIYDQQNNIKYCTPIISTNHNQGRENQNNYLLNPADTNPESHLRHFHRTFPSTTHMSNLPQSQSPNNYEISSHLGTSTGIPEARIHYFPHDPSLPVMYNNGPNFLGRHSYHNSIRMSAVPKVRATRKAHEKPTKKKKMYSDYIGVTYNKTHHKFQACITHYRKQHYLGRFILAADAARAYDISARNLKGIDWKINFKSDAEYEEAKSTEMKTLSEKEIQMKRLKLTPTIQSSSATIPFNNKPNTSSPPIHLESHVLPEHGFQVPTSWADSTPSDTHANLLLTVPIMTPQNDWKDRILGKKLFSTPFKYLSTSQGNQSGVQGYNNNIRPMSSTAAAMKIESNISPIERSSSQSTHSSTALSVDGLKFIEHKIPLKSEGNHHGDNLMHQNKFQWNEIGSSPVSFTEELNNINGCESDFDTSIDSIIKGSSPP